MSAEIDYIRYLVAKGGPDLIDYPEFNCWTQAVHQALLAGSMTTDELQHLRSAFDEALSPKTMQGFALHKPHGYAGDYEIIDRIYLEHTTEDPQLQRWDIYYHEQAATRAVRNRKQYCHDLLDRCTNDHDGPLRVLNIGSGPGRCINEWFIANPLANCHFDCVDVDENAVRYAKALNKPFLSRVEFTVANVLRWSPKPSHYDVIWASGIFDYFSDRVFRVLLGKLLPALACGGELVIGNFSSTNPSRSYMEVIGDWRLHHRSELDLERLARESGVEQCRVSIGSEQEGVNLFLHVKL